MSLEEQVTAAIGAHGLWKGRLKAAIDQGRSDVSVDAVRDDHRCNFGKWMHGPEVEAKIKSTPRFKECVELHRRFHLAAAGVIGLATTGKKQEATQAIGAGSEFHKISAQLTQAMLGLKSA